MANQCHAMDFLGYLGSDADNDDRRQPNDDHWAWIGRSSRDG